MTPRQTALNFRQPSASREDAVFIIEVGHTQPGQGPGSRSPLCPKSVACRLAPISPPAEQRPEASSRSHIDLLLTLGRGLLEGTHSWPHEPPLSAFHREVAGSGASLGTGNTCWEGHGRPAVLIQRAGRRLNPQQPCGGRLTSWGPILCTSSLMRAEVHMPEGSGRAQGGRFTCGGGRAGQGDTRKEYVPVTHRP